MRPRVLTVLGVLKRQPCIAPARSNGSCQIRSLVSREEFVISGGSLTVTGPSEFQNRLEVNSANLVASGAESLISASATTTINGAGLFAQSGGQIRLPGLTDYTNTSGDRVIRATGSGSLLSLPNLTSLSNGTGRTQDLHVEALQGGVIDLSSVNCRI